MPLFTVVLTIIVVGVLLWAINQYVPMDAKVSRILNAVVIIGLIIWLLQVFGVLDPIFGIRVG